MGRPTATGVIFRGKNSNIFYFKHSLTLVNTNKPHMSSKTVTLIEKSGRIWPNKPVVSSGGLISILWHSPVRSLSYSLQQYKTSLFHTVSTVSLLLFHLFFIYNLFLVLS